MKKLVLYTTSGCHLCELAQQMLEIMEAEGQCQWQPIEISDDDQLIERYGVRIPVIGRSGDSVLPREELGWPFSLTELQEWL